MVIAALMIGAMIAAQSTPLGAVRVARGKVNVMQQAAATGLLLAGGATIETGPSGWAELYLHGVGRVRLSAGTRATIDKNVLVLDSGRIWIQSTEGAYQTQLERARCMIARGASVIVEHTQRSGTFVFTRRGEARLVSLREGAEPVTIAAAQVASMPAGAAFPTPARPGGAGIEELVELEAEARLHDAIGARAFLIERALAAKSAEGRRSNILRSEPEIAGGDPASFALESAIKPPPFFEEEVPPKGPNVRVEVTFSEE